MHFVFVRKLPRLYLLIHSKPITQVNHLIIQQIWTPRHILHAVYESKSQLFSEQRLVIEPRCSFLCAVKILRIYSYAQSNEQTSKLTTKRAKERLRGRANERAITFTFSLRTALSVEPLSTITSPKTGSSTINTFPLITGPGFHEFRTGQPTA